MYRWLAILVSFLLLSGCKVGDTGFETDDSDSGACSCCWHNSPDVMSCNFCTDKQWQRRDAESCIDAGKRTFGVDPDYYCSCSGISSSLDNLFHYAKSKSEIVFKDSKIVVASASTEQLNLGDTDKIQTQYGSGSCVQECNNKTEYCMTLKRVNDGVPSQLLRLHHKINQTNGVLARKQIMKIFNQMDDPCNRADTDLSNGKLVNIGGACVFKSTAVISDGSSEPIDVELPGRIEADLTKGGSINVKFSDKGTAPTWKLGEYLDADFGGKIAQVVSTDRSITIGTERGCLQLKY